MRECVVQWHHGSKPKIAKPDHNIEKTNWDYSNYPLLAENST